MALLNTLRFVLTHPLNRGKPINSLGRLASWQLKSRLVSAPIEVSFVDDTKLLVSHGQTGATGNVYTGLHELSEMGFVLHFLRPGELFVDVGSNVGSYTILAGAAGASVIAFEPGAEAYDRLRANIAANNFQGRVVTRNEAVGASECEVLFTQGADTVNHVAVASESFSTTRVSMTTLDAALDARDPVVIKIDVEGFESSVIAGASATLAKPSLRAVIMETNGSGARYSIGDAVLHDAMIKAGFVPCTYDPLTRALALANASSETGNTIFIRDLEDAVKRLTTARKFNIAGRTLL
jgi:FkbM family methyltransferase